MVKCCLCGIDIMGMGNNPAPLNRGKNARCCDKCNREVIIPLRFMEHMSAKRSKEVV